MAAKIITLKHDTHADLLRGKPYLYKHIATIHKSNSLSLLQNKISNVLYFNAYKDLKIKEVHIITIKELCEHLNYKGHNYEEIKQALRGLITTLIEWNMLNDDKLIEENWTASTALASAKLKRGGVCEYSYSYHMRQLLADPVIYASINMGYQANFRSKYGLALYENCARFIKVKQTPWFDIAFFRALMGVEEGKYAEFRDFKRRVLDIAIDEVNMYSDMTIVCTLKRLGRAVDKIKFAIEPRERKSRIKLEPTVTVLEHSVEKWTAAKLELADILKREFLFSHQQIKHCFEEYTIEYIYEKIHVIGQAAKSARSVTAYMLSALRNDYSLQKSFDKIKQDTLKAAENEYELIQAEAFCSKIKLLAKTDDKVQDFLERFKSMLCANYPELHAEYCKTQFKNPTLALTCHDYYLQKFSHLLIDEFEG